MGWLALTALLLGSAPAPATPVPEVDPELEILVSSLLPGQRPEVDRATGGLDRLPRYRLDLVLDPAAHSLRGVAQISIPLHDATDELYFRIPANAPYLDSGSGPAVTLEKTSVRGEDRIPASLDNGVYRIPLDPPADPGTTLELRFELAASIPLLAASALEPEAQLMQQALSLLGSGPGEARTDHGAFGQAGEVVMLAGFFPELVRRDGGVFDLSAEPGVGEPRWGPLAHYTVSLVAPPGFRVAGTGREIGQTPERSGNIRFTRVAAAVRGVALVAGRDFIEQRVERGGVRFRVVAAPGQELQARKLLDVASRATAFFAQQFGPYPWTDLELAAAPLTGGMEALGFPGLVVASPLLTEPERAVSLYASTPGAEGLVDSVLELAVAHHVAHQWWRGVVGNDSRARPALDEPLAVYSAVLFVESRRGARAAARLVDGQLRNAYQVHRLFGAPDRPVDRPLSEYSGRGEVEALLHGKGALYYLALKKLLGAKPLMAALRRHYQTGRFRDHETDGVLLSVAAVAPAKAEAALALHDRFMHQTRGDEDVGGALDLGRALRASGAQVDPATQQLLKQLLDAFGGGPPTTPAAPSNPNPNPKQKPKKHP